MAKLAAGKLQHQGLSLALNARARKPELQTPTENSTSTDNRPTQHFARFIRVNFITWTPAIHQLRKRQLVLE
ncbi:MAG: hypothetical protein AAGG44_12585 [Planctomycetota bacterium]